MHFECQLHTYSPEEGRFVILVQLCFNKSVLLTLQRAEISNKSALGRIHQNKRLCSEH